MPIRQTVIWIY